MHDTITQVLIANNGMAATKSILSMRKWAYFELGDENAVQFVAMATPEDLKVRARARSKLAAVRWVADRWAVAVRWVEFTAAEADLPARD